MSILAGVSVQPVGPSEPVPAVRLRDRLCDAAVGVITSEGWARVTMARLADEVGVSRQTVYNEIGTKADLPRRSSCVSWTGSSPASSARSTRTRPT